MTDNLLPDEREWARLAKAATPGPWRSLEDERRFLAATKAAFVAVPELLRRLSERRKVMSRERGIMNRLLAACQRLHQRWREERLKGAIERDSLRLKRDAARAEVERLKEQVTARERELERFRHGVTLEGDFICPDSLALTEARAKLASIERASCKCAKCVECLGR